MKSNKCPNCSATIQNGATTCPYCNADLSTPTQEAQVINNNIFMLTNNDPKQEVKLVDVKNINPRPSINFFYLTLGIIFGIVPGIIYLCIKNKQKKEWEKTHQAYVAKYKD